MPLILKKPRDGLIAFRLGSVAAPRSTSGVVEQLQEQIKAERAQHALELYPCTAPRSRLRRRSACDPASIFEVETGVAARVAGRKGRNS
jgi:hypothetical protein